MDTIGFVKLDRPAFPSISDSIKEALKFCYRFMDGSKNTLVISEASIRRDYQDQLWLGCKGRDQRHFPIELGSIAR